MKEMQTTYNPKEFEERIYSEWMEGKYFHAAIDKKKVPFTVMMPPPNITGRLHMGHAMDETMQDVIVRFKRMQGYCVLWLPGTDHASLATEHKIVEELQKEALRRNRSRERSFFAAPGLGKSNTAARSSSSFKSSARPAIGTGSPSRSTNAVRTPCAKPFAGCTKRGSSTAGAGSSIGVRPAGRRFRTRKWNTPRTQAAFGISTIPSRGRTKCSRSRRPAPRPCSAIRRSRSIPRTNAINVWSGRRYGFRSGRYPEP